MNDNTAFTIIIIALIVSMFVFMGAIIYSSNQSEQICKTTAIQQKYTIEQIKELCK